MIHFQHLGGTNSIRNEPVAVGHIRIAANSPDSSAVKTRRASGSLARQRTGPIALVRNLTRRIHQPGPRTAKVECSPTPTSIRVRFTDRAGVRAIKHLQLIDVHGGELEDGRGRECSRVSYYIAAGIGHGVSVVGAADGVDGKCGDGDDGGCGCEDSGLFGDCRGLGCGVRDGVGGGHDIGCRCGFEDGERYLLGEDSLVNGTMARTNGRDSQ